MTTRYFRRQKELPDGGTMLLQYKLQTMEGEMKSLKRALETKEAEMEDGIFRRNKIKVEKFGE